MKDCVLLLCLAITMTPRLNHVRSSNTPAVVEMPITSLLKRIATMSAEKVRLFVFCQSQADKVIQITGVLSLLFCSPWLATSVCFLHFGLDVFKGREN